MRRIRRATPDDAAAIAALAAQVQRLHHEADPATYKPPDHGATVGLFRGQLSDPDRVVFVAEDDGGNAIGYVVTYMRAAEEHVLKHAAAFVELNEIGVDERHRGKGVGRALHERVVEHWTAAGAPEIRLTVIGFNTGARDYYEHLGFSELSRRMALRLPGGGV